MKKRLIITLAVIAVIALIAVLVFSVFFQPPGNLRHPFFLRRAPRSDVGETVRVFMKQIREQSEGGLCFAYIFNAQSNSGRLALFTYVPDDLSVFCLTVYEPEWKGIDRMCDAFADGFHAKIVERAYITFEEAMNIQASFIVDEYYDDSEVVAFPSPEPTDTEDIYYYYGMFGDTEAVASWYRGEGEAPLYEIEGGLAVMAVGNVESQFSYGMESATQVLKRTAERFHLMDDLGIP